MFIVNFIVNLVDLIARLVAANPVLFGFWMTYIGYSVIRADREEHRISVLLAQLSMIQEEITSLEGEQN